MIDDKIIDGEEHPSDFLPMLGDDMDGSDDDGFAFNEDAYEDSWIQADPWAVQPVGHIDVNDLDGDEMAVFGLGMAKPEDQDELKAARVRPILLGLLGIAMVAALGGLIYMRAHAPEPNFDPIEDEYVQIPVVKEEEAVEPGMSAADIRSLVSGRLTYAGGGVAPGTGSIEVQISEDGKVLVTHKVPAGQLVASTMVDMAGKRANALAARLEGKKVAATEGEEGVEFAGLTWVLCNAEGQPYLAVSEAPGAERTSDASFGVLAGSAGYVISDDLYTAIGAEGSGIAQKGGTAPTDLDGSEIAATASFPLPQAAGGEDDDVDDAGVTYYDDGATDTGATAAGGQTGRTSTSGQSGRTSGGTSSGGTTTQPTTPTVPDTPSEPTTPEEPSEPTYPEEPGGGDVDPTPGDQGGDGGGSIVED